MSSDKIVNDAIYGFITLKPYIVTIIDTPEFQRLRSIWQLGVTPFVYPTADHCRFEHSIGTYWLASKLVTKLQKQLDEQLKKELDEQLKKELQKKSEEQFKKDLEEQFKNERVISDEDVKCVEIAALCHDLGHGPFSHTWDNKVLPAFCGNDTFQHDKDFGEVWEILKKNRKVEEMLRINSLKKVHEKLIIKLINGETTDGKEILCSIISNFESGMDVDKWDYLARDASYLGHAATNYRVDIERMILRSRAVKDGEKWKIAYRESESINMLRVFQMRHYIHQTAVLHKKVIAIELLLLDGIKDCIEKKILNKDEIGTSKWILRSTDAVFWNNTKEIPAFERIFTRELYKQICTARQYVCTEDPTEKLSEFLEKEHVEVRYLRFGFTKFRLGNRDTNPILKVPFYKVNKRDEIFYFTKDNLPSYLRMNFDESRLMVFFDGKGYCEEIQRNLVNYFRNCVKRQNDCFGFEFQSLLEGELNKLQKFKKVFEIIDSNNPKYEINKYLEDTDFGKGNIVVVICQFKNDDVTICVCKKHSVKGWMKCCEIIIQPNITFKCEGVTMVLLYNDFDISGINKIIVDHLTKEHWIIECTQ